MSAGGPLLRPFDGFLPLPGMGERVVAPEYEKAPPDDPRNPLAFLNDVRSEIDRPQYSYAGRRNLLRRTAVRLRALLEGGPYRYYPAPAYVICRLEEGGHTQTGVVAEVALDGYHRDHVKFHEGTQKAREDRLVEYMHVVRTNFLPVFLIHRALEAVNVAVARVTAGEPAVTCVVDGALGVTLWTVTEPEAIADLDSALSGIHELYIADGHHRTAAAIRFAAEQPDVASASRMLSVVFPSDQLVVHAYNRCVSDLGGQTPGQFLTKVADGFTVRAVPPAGDPRPEVAGEFSMVLDGAWYRLQPRSDRVELGVAGLDVTILEELLLGPILGVADPGSDPRLAFVPGTLGVAELERMCATDYAVGFAVHPMAVEQLMRVADRNELMPPKSTWFAPKLRSGLIVSEF